MGCGASSGKKDIQYLNGTPDFKADEVTKGFDKENGLLFRLVDRKKKQWAYYNDTTQYVMHVTVTFNEDCDIRALGNTVLERQENGEWVATVRVLPTKTELFIEGRVNGFKSKMDALPLADAQGTGSSAATYPQTA